MNPYVALLKTAWRYAENERKEYIIVYTLFILSSLADMMLPILLGVFTDKLQKDSKNALDYALWYGSIYLLLKFLGWVFHGPARIMERKLAFNMGRNFLMEMYHQALHLPIKWHQDNHSGATINRIRKAYEALRNFFQDGFLYLYAMTKFIFSFLAMVYFSPFFGSIGILLGVFTIWIILKFDKPLIKALDETNEKEHLISSTLFDSLSNIITVITLRLEKSMEMGLLSKISDVWLPFKRKILINEGKWFVADMLVCLIYAIIAVGYVYQNGQKDTVFQVGGLITLLGFVNQFTSVFHDVAWQYNQIIQYNTDIQTARNIGEAFNENHRAENSQTLPDNWHHIHIKNVNFSHRDTYDAAHAPQSLHDINIEFKKGQRIAFIGESGCGKSTLLALLRGLYTPQYSLDFKVDNKPFDIASLNETVTLFPQEPEIFENSLEYNITLGLPFDEKMIWDVCDLAQFTETAKQLPNSLKSNIKEKGVNLSGGQKQRLALARGILAAQTSQVVLMDEPTSSVDAKTESMIYDTLFKAFSEKVIISSLHRLHLLEHFDYVYVLQNGRIVEEGTFPYLQNNGLIFKELWRYQEIKHKSEGA